MFIFVFLFNFVMNGLPYVSDECRVSVLFLDRVFKVTGLGVVVREGPVTTSAGCHVLQLMFQDMVNISS